MKKAIYLSALISFVIQCCEIAPDVEGSYTVEYFCFDGYRGVGVVSIPDSVGSYDIPVFAAPEEEADLFASFVVEVTSLTKSFTIEGGGVTKDAFFEFNYEHSGVPVELIQ